MTSAMVRNNRRTLIKMPPTLIQDIAKLVTSSVEALRQYFIIIRENLSRMAFIPLTDDVHHVTPRIACSSTAVLNGGK